MRDHFDRTIDYLRISIIDRCNLRCLYCMPQSGLKPLAHEDILTYEEIIRIARIASRLGVRKIRITGGEPLVRRDLPWLIESLASIEAIEDLSLTTNGILLAELAPVLAEAGLTRVNVSLDSLRPERFSDITRGGDLGKVLAGIDAAERAGLLPIKLNMVPIRGINEDEIEEFARLTLKTPYQVRFIEFMPVGANQFWSPERHVATEEIRATVERIGPLTPVKVRRSGPARHFRIGDAPGVVGFISAITHHFCGSCNRLRLTAEGKLRPCLFSETEIDLRAAIRSDAPDTEIERLLSLAVEVKPKCHDLSGERNLDDFRPMSKIGG